MYNQHAEAKDTVEAVGIVSLANGGTAANTAPRAARNLNMLLASQADEPFGPIRIDSETGLIPRHYFDGVADYRAEVTGPKTVQPGSVNEYFITNYDSRIEYTTQAISGLVRIEEDKIFYTAPVDITKPAGFVLNGEAWSLNFG